jgi:hypothetical protein
VGGTCVKCKDRVGFVPLEELLAGGNAGLFLWRDRRTAAHAVLVAPRQGKRTTNRGLATRCQQDGGSPVWSKNPSDRLFMRPLDEFLVHRPCDVGQHAYPIHDGPPS